MHARCASLARRRNVVPRAAKLVVRHDDQRLRGMRAAVDCFEQISQMLASAGDCRVPGMFVLFADRLHEAYRLQAAVLRGVDEFGFIPQVSRPRGGSRRISGVVVERLVVKPGLRYDPMAKIRRTRLASSERCNFTEAFGRVD